MTRQPKTNGLFTEDEFNEACRLILQVRRGYRRWSRLRKIRNGIVQRRRKKGRRAKSGQWWRRYPRAVLWGSDVGRCVDATIGVSVRTNA